MPNGYEQERSQKRIDEIKDCCTQPYIYGKEVHSENLSDEEWNIYMVGLGGLPIMRGLTKEAAEFIVDCVNSSVPDEFTALRL